jgi:hypothetical protein
MVVFDSNNRSAITFLILVRGISIYCPVAEGAGAAALGAAGLEGVTASGFSAFGAFASAFSKLN